MSEAAPISDRVAEVLASPLDQAVSACSYWVVMGQGPALEALWGQAVDQALAEAVHFADEA